MGGVTTDKGYPYPTGSDRVMDGDNAIQALAQTVDNSIQSGAVVVTPVADTPTSVAVVYAHPYASPPVVMLTSTAGPPSGNYSMSIYVSGPSASGFSVGVKRSNVQPATIYWLAIGKLA